MSMKMSRDRNRTGESKRETKEVEIRVSVDLDGRGEFRGRSGSAFVDHMLRTLSRHSQIDIRVHAKGDLRHHIIEDLAITLGRALDSALGEKVGITRFGFAYVPMDDSLARVVIDLGGRAYTKIYLGVKGESIEDTKVEDILHFMEALSQSLRCNLHVRVLYGSNDHHRVEAAVKALALALKMAVLRSGSEGVPSAKGEI
ncbi:MAG: imidazoleglycerol-phosphate dehydratase [Candidatus Verstraetearchaeota archaeon]|nr:imidazoleglycerol-phosphate dehydratase [Candidatus Verstraetearchaeota archaeon]